MKTFVQNTLPAYEMLEVIESMYADKLIILAHVFGEHLFGMTGSGKVFKVPLTIFKPSGDGTTPDFNRMRVSPWGHGIIFGEYEAAADAILEENLLQEGFQT